MRPRFFALPMRAVALCAVALVGLKANARADDADRLRSDAKRSQGLRSFRLQIAAVTPDSGVTKETLTYVAPDSLRVDVPSKNFSAVIIGSYLWVRKGARRWRRGTLTEASDALAAVRRNASIADRIDGKHVRFLGDATLAGRTMRVYEIVGPRKSTALPATERIWIGVHDGFPHRIVQRDGAFVSTATYSSFNQTFSVSQ